MYDKARENINKIYNKNIWCCSCGFFLLAYQQTVVGTALIGIGSLLIAVGER